MVAVALRISNSPREDLVLSSFSFPSKTGSLMRLGARFVHLQTGMMAGSNPSLVGLLNFLTPSEGRKVVETLAGPVCVWI